MKLIKKNSLTLSQFCWFEVTESNPVVYTGSHLYCSEDAFLGESSVVIAKG